MIEIALRDIEKYYGADHLIKGVTFEIQIGERIGLLGKNGTGKTTLLNILAGVIPSDNGEVMIRKGSLVSVLEQFTDFPEDYTAYEALCSAYSDLLEIKAQMIALEQTMTDVTDIDNTLEKYGHLQQNFEARHGYEMEENIKKVCTGLGFSYELLATNFSMLSGGEKTRVMLGRLLINNSQILLLDEPTNHLDVTAIEWLEKFVHEYKGTVVVISHDRYFLNQVVTRIVELSDGKIDLYEGNYSYFVAEKKARCLQRQEEFNQEQKKIKRMQNSAKQLHEWAQRGDSPSLHKRALNMEKRIERMEKVERPQYEQRMQTKFNEHTFSGQEVLVAKNLSKNFDDHNILNSLDFTLYRGERTVLLGTNGSGKSTLLKIITGEIIPDAGEVKLGNSIKYAYLPQIVTFAHPMLSVLETVSYELDISENDARHILARYCFKGEGVYRTTGKLSGGEKSRLRLCLMMQNNVNLLLLDEPTNHLDIDSREWLEKALDDFKGTVLFVSHDRYFINKFASRIWELKNGKLTKYDGNYDFYLQKKIRNEQLEYQTRHTQSKITDVHKSSRIVTKLPVSVHTETISKKAIVEIEKIENAIKELESALAALETRMQLCGSDFLTMEPLLLQKKEWEDTRGALYQEWLKINGS
jgi:ATPase subunit of ABC transporter with duplicated ATPase domains